MTTTPKVLIQSKLAEDALTKQYEAVNCKASIDKFTATNITASNVTLLVHLVPNGQSASTANQYGPFTIAPGKTSSLPECVGHILESGGSVWTDPSAASAVSIRASGREYTT